MRIDSSGLIHFLPTQRWFGSDEPLESVDVDDYAVLDEERPRLILALLDVRFATGRRELYQAPLLVDDDGNVRDALAETSRLGTLGGLLAHGDSIKGSRGTFRFGGPGLDPLSPPGSSSVRIMGAEQSNSSIVLDDAVILKLIRRLEIGNNPELELCRYLTNAGFENIPPQVGEIFYRRDEDGHEINIDLGIAQQFVTEATDGWDETVRAVRSLYESVGEHTPKDVDEVVEERAADIVEKLGALGVVTSSMHVLMARGDEPDISAEPVTQVDLKDWADRAHDALDGLLGRGRSDGPARVPELQPLAAAIEARIEGLRDIDRAGLKTRIHGDYHLGQTMRAPRGWLLLDFEGEPMRPLEARRERQSPLRDVAGILRSFSYAAYVVLFERAEPDSDEWTRLEEWAAGFERVVRDRFLHDYLRTSHEGEFLPPDREDLAIMLDVFEIDKALYEVGYEIAHRPPWLRIPLRGIADVIERGGIR